MKNTLLLATLVGITSGCASTSLDPGHGHGPEYGHGHGHVHEEGVKLPTPPAESEVEADLRLQIERAMEDHDFALAERLMGRLRELRPNDRWAALLLSDALLEQGRVTEAEQALQPVLDLKPTGASYLRAAYLLHLRGDTAYGVEIAGLAIDSLSPIDTESRAWALAEKGDLLWQTGDLDGADAAYQGALRLHPQLARAKVGLGHVAAANGQLTSAAALLEEGARTPAQLGELAAVYRALGDPARARRSVARAVRMLRQDPGHWSRSTARCLADAGVRTRWAVDLARAELERRGTVHSWDALSWALTRDGQFEKALAAAERALALGTTEPLLLFHAGMAAAGAGDAERARTWLEQSLALNPNFHPEFSRLARVTLSSLESNS